VPVTVATSVMASGVPAASDAISSTLSVPPVPITLSTALSATGPAADNSVTVSAPVEPTIDSTLLADSAPADIMWTVSPAAVDA
jgi:hypothetical protein